MCSVVNAGVSTVGVATVCAVVGGWKRRWRCVRLMMIRRGRAAATVAVRMRGAYLREKFVVRDVYAGAERW